MAHCKTIPQMSAAELRKFMRAMRIAAFVIPVPFLVMATLFGTRVIDIGPPLNDWMALILLIMIVPEVLMFRFLGARAAKRLAELEKDAA